MLRPFAVSFTGILGLVLAGVVLPATAASIPLPGSMAATGDSITRAFDINAAHLLSDSPQDSWSTGTDSVVDSQYQRILVLNPAIAGHAFNDAKTGAKMADLDGQVKTAAGQHVAYLTILMGANDVCTSSVSNMTPTSTFRSEFHQALSDFFGRDPSAHVYVSSIPNIFQLWSLLHNNFNAELIWGLFGICQSMLSLGDSSSDRQKVSIQEAADNSTLATVCGQFANCRWDTYAGFNFAFPTGDISTVDYFHPDVQGQHDIAALTWKAGYWGT
jgi:lysophospholipase L1-like esterase